MTRATIFVAYPWAAHDPDDYKVRYRSLEYKHDIAFVFAEDRLTSDHLITKIEGMMVAAAFCIFDLTDLNPNVMLEYGLARGLRLETYIAFNPRDASRDVPSDLKGLDSLRYSSLDDLEKRLAAFLDQALAPEGRRRREDQARIPSRDQEQFDAELNAIPRTPLLSKIDSRGQLFTRIRPARYEPGRVAYRAMQDVIGSAKVQHRSYGFPFTDALHNFPQLDLDSYGREFDLGYFKESWRFFQSGLFVGWRALPEDWPEEWTQPVPPNLVSLKAILPRGATAHIIEVFEFAAGLATTLPGTDPLIVTLHVTPTAGRELLAEFDMTDIGLEFELRGRTTVMSAFAPRDFTLTRAQLKDDWEAIGLGVASDFFDRFGFNAGQERMRRWAGLRA